MNIIVTKPFYPNVWKKRKAWHRAFYNGIKKYEVQLSIDAPTLASVLADTKVVEYMVDGDATISQYLTSFLGLKNGMMRFSPGNPTAVIAYPVMDAMVPTPAPAVVDYGILDRTFELIRIIRTNTNLTAEMATELGITGAEVTIDSDTLFPTLNITKGAMGYPLIKYVKGIADGVSLYRDLNDGLGFVAYRIINKTKFLDKGVVPLQGQTRTIKYKAYYILNDEVIGQVSNEVAFNVTGAVAV